jgi:hypothetical protein
MVLLRGEFHDELFGGDVFETGQLCFDVVLPAPVQSPTAREKYEEEDFSFDKKTDEQNSEFLVNLDHPSEYNESEFRYHASSFEYMAALISFSLQASLVAARFFSLFQHSAHFFRSTSFFQRRQKIIDPSPG